MPSDQGFTRRLGLLGLLPPRPTAAGKPWLGYCKAPGPTAPKPSARIISLPQQQLGQERRNGTMSEGSGLLEHAAGIPHADAGRPAHRPGEEHAHRFASAHAHRRRFPTSPMAMKAVMLSQESFQALQHAVAHAMETKLGGNLAALATTMLFYTGIIMVEFAINDLLDIYLGDSVLGSLACTAVGLFIIFIIRLSGLKVINLFTNG